MLTKAPLEYLNEDILMECAICHKKESSKTRCVNGHYVCNECHTKGIDSIFGICFAETSVHRKKMPVFNGKSLKKIKKQIWMFIYHRCTGGI